MKTNELVGIKVYLPKKQNKKDKEARQQRSSKLGRIHVIVFDSDLPQVVGVMVKRPDIAGMVKRNDVFVAFDALTTFDKGFLVAQPEGSLDKKAISRLGLDWDRCIMWHGMQAVTESGKTLGFVSGADFNPATGHVNNFLVDSGSSAAALIGSFEIKPEWVLGYRDDAMILTADAESAALSGGLAGKAGEGYAAAVAKGSELAGKAGKAMSEASVKGGRSLGRMIGKAKRALEDVTEPEDATEPRPDPVPAEAVALEEPSTEKSLGGTVSQEPVKTYAPTSQKSSSTKKKASSRVTSDGAAKSFGKQLGRMGKMFSSFKDEFDEASK